MPVSKVEVLVNETDDTYSAFLNSLSKSGLIEHELLSQIVGKYEANSDVNRAPDDRVTGLIRILLGDAILTGWQCGKLMLGKHKGFFIGDYEMRDYLGARVDSDETHAFLARDLRAPETEVVIEFVQLEQQLRSGKAPEFSVKYQRRLTDKPV